MNSIPRKQQNQFANRQWCYWLLLILVVWMLCTSAYHAGVSNGPGLKGYDFTCFYTAAQRLNAGSSIYDANDKLVYLYTPVLAIILRPLARLSFDKAYGIWLIMNIACLVLSVGMFAKSLQLKRDYQVAVCIMLLLGFRFWPTVIDQTFGQCNCLLLALMCGMHLADQRRQYYLLGALIAVAASVKLIMLFVIAHLLLRRAYRAAAYALAVFALIVCLSFTLAGWEQWPLYIRALHALTGSSKETTIILSQSISGFAKMHFEATYYTQPLLHSKAMLQAVTLGGYAVILGMLFLAWKWLGKITIASPVRSRLPLNLVTVSMLMLSTFTEIHHMVLLLPLLWTILVMALQERVHIVTFFTATGVYILFTRPTLAALPASSPFIVKSLWFMLYFYLAMILLFVTFLTLAESVKTHWEPQRAPLEK